MRVSPTAGPRPRPPPPPRQRARRRKNARCRGPASTRRNSSAAKACGVAPRRRRAVLTVQGGAARESLQDDSQKHFSRMASRRNRKRNGKYPFRVGGSRHGPGLFATHPTKKGKFIVEYKGPLLNNEQGEKHAKNNLFE